MHVASGYVRVPASIHVLTRGQFRTLWADHAPSIFYLARLLSVVSDQIMVSVNHPMPWAGKPLAGLTRTTR